MGKLKYKLKRQTPKPKNINFKRHIAWAFAQDRARALGLSTSAYIESLVSCEINERHRP